MKSIISFFFLTLFISSSLTAGLPNISIGRNFHARPLAELILYLENEHGLQFFYLEKWIDNINVIQHSTPDLLKNVLEESLQNTNLQYFSDNQKNIILSYQYRIESSIHASLLSTHHELTKENKVLDESSFIALRQTRNADQDGSISQIGISGDGSKSSMAVVSGFIHEKETGLPVPGAVVYVNNLKTGTVTDFYGYYVLSIPTGNHELLFKSLGRRDQVVKVLVNGNGTFNISLEEQLLELRGVVIVADRDQNVRGLQIGLDKLDIQTIKLIPSNIGEADIMKSALFLPGVQTVGEGASGFNVRGGNTDQNLILMDGAPLFNSSHVFGFFSVFNPDIVRSFELYKSGIPSRFGGRLSSVLDVNLKNGNFKKIAVSGGISPVAGRLTVDGPIVKDKTTFIISSRGSHSDWIFHRIDVPELKNSTASFYDLNAKVYSLINETNELSLSSYFSEDHFKLNYDTLYSYRNTNGSITYKHMFSQKIYGTVSGIFSNYTYSMKSDAHQHYAFDLNYLIRYKEARTDFTWFLNPNHKLSFGANVIHYMINPGTMNPVGSESLILPNDLPDEQALETGIYLSDEHTISTNLSLSYGLRYSGFLTMGPLKVYDYVPGSPRTILNRIDSIEYAKNAIADRTGGPELRLSARYRTGPYSSVKLNFTRMNQYLHMLSNTTAISPTDTWKVSGPNLPHQKSWQYSAGFYKDFASRSLETSIEIYYKDSKDILEYRGGTNMIMNPDLEIDLLHGTGRAYGLELLVKKKLGSLNGWASYTYSRSLVKVDNEYLIDQINQGNYFPSNYDKPHDITLVANYMFYRRLSFSNTLTYSTGRPITYPVAKYQFRNRELIHYSNRNEYRIPNYFRWDASVNFGESLKSEKRVRSSFSISVYNLTGRKNVYSIFFVSDARKRVQGYKLSVFAQPVLSVTWNFRF